MPAAARFVMPLIAIAVIPFSVLGEEHRVGGETCGCSCPCFFPWAVSDRWDDETLDDGHPEWVGNGVWDTEEFTDLDDSGIWDPGEPYVDADGNGAFDREFYHPLITGYSALLDAGVPILVHANHWRQTGLPGFHFAVEFPAPELKGTGARRYVATILDCSVAAADFGARPLLGRMEGPTTWAVQRLIASDPGAYWSETEGRVVGSAFPFSPRSGLLLFYDPRRSASIRDDGITATKYAGIFIENVDEQGGVWARFQSLDGCPSCSSAWGLDRFENPESAELPAGEFPDDRLGSPEPSGESWGRLKSLYR